MQARLTILCENSVGMPFGGVGEHGFACHVETDHGTWLFDTGQGFGLRQNATALGIDLTAVRAIMISHGHYDHTGGLPDALPCTGKIDVHGHPDMFLPRFWGTGEDDQRYIGIPYRRDYLESLGARFQLDTGMKEIGPGIYLTGEIPRTTDFETGDPNMTLVTTDGRRLRPDPLRDDLSLVVDTDKGLILILGCAHAGLVNIMNYVLRELHRDRIHAVIGGTHLGFSGDEQFEKTLAALNDYHIDLLGVSHCTGLDKAARLHHILGERFFFGCVGARLEA